MLGYDDVEVVLRLVDVCAHGYDAGDARGISFRRPCARRMHNRVFCGTQEVRGTAEAVEHTGAHDAGAVCVGVDVDFDGGVHADDAEAADDLGRVGDLLGAEEQLGCVSFIPLMKTFESVGGEPDTGCGGEVEVARVKEVEETVLEDFGPDFEILKIGTSRLYHHC